MGTLISHSLGEGTNLCNDTDTAKIANDDRLVDYKLTVHSGEKEKLELKKFGTHSSILHVVNPENTTQVIEDNV